MRGRVGGVSEGTRGEEREERERKREGEEGEREWGLLHYLKLACGAMTKVFMYVSRSSGTTANNYIYIYTM